MGKCCASYATSRDVARRPGASLVPAGASLMPAGASLAPGRGCVDCLNLIGQYNLHELCRPITPFKNLGQTNTRQTPDTIHTESSQIIVSRFGY